MFWLLVGKNGPKSVITIKKRTKLLTFEVEYMMEEQ